ncbi:unnamed protein product, partial [Phaeothamnion confervicola]
PLAVAAPSVPLKSVSLPAADSLFECAICTDHMAIAAVIPCGHSFCWACMKEWCSRGETETMECPSCRVSVPRGDFRRCIALDDAIAGEVFRLGLGGDEWQGRLDAGRRAAANHEAERRRVQDEKRRREEEEQRERREFHQQRQELTRIHLPPGMFFGSARPAPGSSGSGGGGFTGRSAAQLDPSLYGGSGRMHEAYRAFTQATAASRALGGRPGRYAASIGAFEAWE